MLSAPDHRRLAAGGTGRDARAARGPRAAALPDERAGQRPAQTPTGAAPKPPRDHLRPLRRRDRTRAGQGRDPFSPALPARAAPRKRADLPRGDAGPPTPHPAHQLRDARIPAASPQRQRPLRRTDRRALAVPRPR